MMMVGYIYDVIVLVVTMKELIYDHSVGVEES